MSEMETKVGPPIGDLISVVAALCPTVHREFTVTCERRAGDLFLSYAVRVGVAETKPEGARP